MNIGPRINPIWIDLAEAICDDCSEAVDIESYEAPCGCGCHMMCTEYQTEPHHGCMGSSYRFTSIDWGRRGALALATYYRPEVP